MPLTGSRLNYTSSTFNITDLLGLFVCLFFKLKMISLKNERHLRLRADGQAKIGIQRDS